MYVCSVMSATLIFSIKCMRFVPHDAMEFFLFFAVLLLFHLLVFFRSVDAILHFIYTSSPNYFMSSLTGAAQKKLQTEWKTLAVMQHCSLISHECELARDYYKSAISIRDSTTGFHLRSQCVSWGVNAFLPAEICSQYATLCQDVRKVQSSSWCSYSVANFLREVQLRMNKLLWFQHLEVTLMFQFNYWKYYAR